MSQEKFDIIIELLKRGDGAFLAEKDLLALEKQTKKTNDSLVAMASEFRTAMTAIAGAALIHNAVRAFAEQDAAVAKLNGSLRAANVFSKEYSESLQAMAEGLEKVTMFSSESVMAAQSLLISFGASRQEMPKLTQSVLDLAAGLGTDLSSAALMVSKALQGDMAALSRWVGHVDESKSKSEQLAAALHGIDRNFKNLAREGASSLSGSMRQTANSIGDLKKELGRVIVEGLDPFMEKIREVARLIVSPAGDGAMRAQQEMTRGTLERVIEARVKSGELQSARALQLLNVLKGGGAFDVGTSDNRQRMLDLMMNEFRPDLFKGPAQEPGVQVRVNAEEKRKALEDLKKLEDQMNLDSLEGFDKERFAAALNFDERKKQIEDLGKVEGVNTDFAMKLATEAYDKQLADIRAKRRAEDDKIIDETEERVRRESAIQVKAFQEMQSLRRQLSVGAMNPFDAATAKNDFNLSDQLEQLETLRNSLQITQDEFDQMTDDAIAGWEAQTVEIKATRAELEQTMFKQTQLGQTAQFAATQFSTGFAHAFVEFARGAKSAGEAFKTFASDFLAQLAEMILMQTILNAISGTKWGKALGITGATSRAEGGQDVRVRAFASGGMAGVASIDQPTFFPQFNVLAGEAGREIMTVMARPRMMEIGGITAQVGDVAGRRLAITDANDLAKRPAGGLAVIELRVSRDTEARIQSNSIEGAVLRVVHDMGRQTPISEATKSLINR